MGRLPLYTDPTLVVEPQNSVPIFLCITLGSGLHTALTNAELGFDCGATSWIEALPKNFGVHIK